MSHSKYLITNSWYLIPGKLACFRQKTNRSLVNRLDHGCAQTFASLMTVNAQTLKFCLKLSLTTTCCSLSKKIILDFVFFEPCVHVASLSQPADILYGSFIFPHAATQIARGFRPNNGGSGVLLQLQLLQPHL